PGSRWLYAKLYAGPAAADQVLREVVGPLVEQARAAGLVDRWFFLRYADPEGHVRLRLRGEPGALLARVVPLLHDAAAPLLADGRVTRLVLDTYVRELERYGPGPGVDLAERLSEIDSDAALAITRAIEGDAGQDA